MEKQWFDDTLMIDFNEERDDVYVLFLEKLYIFDQKGYRIFEELWDKGLLKPDKNNYLCVKDNDWGDLMSVHRYLKIKEIEELAKKLGVEEKEIHIHHKDKEKENNRLTNLEVLYKDAHARKHGFDTWKEYQEWRKRNKLK